MRTISLHVPEASYEELKSLAAGESRPVAALIRQAMEEFVARHRRAGVSLRDLQPHDSGPMTDGWSRTELYDEMLDP